MRGAHFPRITAVWKEEVSRAEEVFPGLLDIVQARVTPDAGLTGRAFGFFDEETSVVGLSPRLEAEPTHRIQGIVRHELGHACDFHFGDSPSSAPGAEKRADSIAALLGGAPLGYDDWDVQTSLPGRKTRPGHLHQ